MRYALRLVYNRRKTQTASHNATQCVGRGHNDAKYTVYNRCKANAKQRSVAMNERDRKLLLLSLGLILNAVALKTKLHLSQRDRRS